MAQLIDHPQRVSVAQVCVLMGTLLASGCSQSNPQMDTSGQPFVHVIYQGQPLSDVQVRLHENLNGPALAQSISQQDGNAYFGDVPSPEPPKYFVTLESISDGGWILDPKVRHELSKSISLEPFESSREQQIEIPKGAIKPLTSSKRR